VLVRSGVPVEEQALSAHAVASAVGTSVRSMRGRGVRVRPSVGLTSPWSLRYRYTEARADVDQGPETLTNVGGPESRAADA
jgi:hypothetical protein